MANDSMRRYDPNAYGPFAWMREMQDQVDRTLTNFWGGKPMAPQRGKMFSTDWSPDLDVFQRGNELVVRADVPVILMSGFTEQDASARFRGLGLAGFVQKPFESDALVVALRSALEKPVHSFESKLVFPWMKSSLGGDPWMSL